MVLAMPEEISNIQAESNGSGFRIARSGVEDISEVILWILIIKNKFVKH